MHDSAIDLTGRRILVVEDDSALALDLCNDLRRCGATVLGPAPTSYYAYNLLLGRRGIDGAILDTDLYGSDVYDLAEELRQRGIPMVFATENSGEEIDDAFRDTPRLQKPLAIDELVIKAGWLVDGASEHSKDVPMRFARRNDEMQRGQVTGSISDRLGRAVVRSIALQR